MKEPPKESRRSLYFLLTGAVTFFLILAMPVPDGLSVPARNMMAVAALMAVWWLGEAAPIPVTALLPLVLYPLLGILPSSKVGPFYGHHLIFLYLGGFMIGLAMQRTGLHRRFALNVIRIVGSELKRLVLGFMMACAFLSMWISNTATTLLLLPVAMAVVRQVASCAVIEGKSEKETQDLVASGFGLILMLGLAYSASIGGVGTLIGTPPNIIFAGFWKLQFPGREEISFFSWMMIALPLVVIFLPIVWWVLCRFVSPIPLGKIESSGQAEQILLAEIRSLGAMRRAETFVAVVFAATGFLWIFRKPISLGLFSLPGWSGLLPWPDFPHDATVAVGMGLLLMIVPLKIFNRTQEIPIELEQPRQELSVALDWETFSKGVPWGILLLFGGGFALAGGFRATGLDVWIGNHLAGVQHWPLWMVVLSLCLGLTFLTEMTSNTATATMILPVIASGAEAAGIEPLLLLVPATLSVSCAFMMPVATPPNAIVFSSGWVTIPQMARVGVVLNLLGAALITLITLLLVPRILI